MMRMCFASLYAVLAAGAASAGQAVTADAATTSAPPTAQQSDAMVAPVKRVAPTLPAIKDKVEKTKGADSTKRSAKAAKRTAEKTQAKNRAKKMR